jgi:site-specific DNA recombinase
VAFEQATQRRASCTPNAAPPRVVSSPAPLVGLLRCGYCGAGMNQASGKSGRYRYYKCTTRLNKNVDACTAKNLPREQTDRMMLAALSERVFTPKRVSLRLNELLRHQAAGQDGGRCAPHHPEKEQGNRRRASET